MMDSVKIGLPPHDPIASTLSAADDRIVTSEWLPPQEGIVPRIRIGRRWINILWALPIGAAALVLLIALAQSLRELQSVQAFIKEYPGIAGPCSTGKRPVPSTLSRFAGSCFSFWRTGSWCSLPV